jgi:predicted MPP superfamily phosphohydrolase
MTGSGSKNQAEPSAGMRRVIDPRNGDIESDASSPKSRSMLALAGSLLAEVSLPKLVVAWTSLIALPAVTLGAIPIAAFVWIDVIKLKLSVLYLGLSSLLVLALVVAVGLIGGRHLFRLAERSFWSLNSLAVQPGYALCREGLSQLAEAFLPSTAARTRRATWRAVTAVASGILICCLSLVLVWLVWPRVRLVVEFATIDSVSWLVTVALANSIALVSAYLAVAALVWAIADATMPAPRSLSRFDARAQEDRVWRIAHLSDLHVVGERYGFRIESGRSGPRGNERLMHALARLLELHSECPLDAILITGDITDAGAATEWAEFLDALTSYPQLAERALVIPGNHDLNIVDRTNPARFDLPTSPFKKLRKIRMLCAMNAVQGARALTVDRQNRRLGSSLEQALSGHAGKMARFADTGKPRIARELNEVWSNVFPLVLPPDADDGLGIILLNSNADTHFSFTNALGMIPADQFRGLEIAVDQYPRACWIVALHHHVVEYPMAAKALSERIGTALINGNWFVRRLRRLADRIVLMHGHRHIDWMGECGGLVVLSAPSVVMEATDNVESHFYVHTIAVGRDARLRLLPPRKVVVEGRQSTCG